MKLNVKITLIAFGISLIAKSSVAQNANDQSATGSPITAQHFVWEAATTDMKEIKMGELALEKSDNADVKAFAEHLIADHKKACKKLRGIAESEGLQFPDTNSINLYEGQNGDGNSNPNWNAEATNS